MAQRSTRLPKRFPVGSKYVIESRGFDNEGGQVLQRYVEFPDGRIVNLSTRKLLPLASCQVSVVPEIDSSAHCLQRTARLRV